MTYHDFKFYDIYLNHALKYEGSMRTQFFMALILYCAGGGIDHFSIEIQNDVREIVVIDKPKEKRLKPRAADAQKYVSGKRVRKFYD